MPKPDFSKIKALLGEATGGEWKHLNEYSLDVKTYVFTSSGVIAASVLNADAALIVELRNNIEGIMEYVEEMEDEIKNLNSEIGGLKWQD